MTVNTLLNVALAIAVVGYVIYQQLTWRPVEMAKIWSGPAVLALIGVLQMRELASRPISVTEVVFLLAGLLLSAVFGLILAAMAQLRWEGDTLHKRMGIGGAGVWITYGVLRLGVGTAGHFLGATLTASGGSIMLGLAVNMAATALVLSARSGQLAAARSR